MDSVFLDILNDIGTNFNDKLFVLMHKTFNLPFKISFILKIIPIFTNFYFNIKHTNTNLSHK